MISQHKIFEAITKYKVEFHSIQFPCNPEFYFQLIHLTAERFCQLKNGRTVHAFHRFLYVDLLAFYPSRSFKIKLEILLFQWRCLDSHYESNKQKRRSKTVCLRQMGILFWSYFRLLVIFL